MRKYEYRISRYNEMRDRIKRQKEKGEKFKWYQK